MREPNPLIPPFAADLVYAAQERSPVNSDDLDTDDQGRLHQ